MKRADIVELPRLSYSKVSIMAKIDKAIERENGRSRNVEVGTYES